MIWLHQATAGAISTQLCSHSLWSVYTRLCECVCVCARVICPCPLGALVLQQTCNTSTANKAQLLLSKNSLPQQSIFNLYV